MFISPIQPKDYVVLHNISEGTYGEIFKVQHKVTKDVYALKTVLRSYLEKQLKLHEGIIEMEILKVIQHPGIIRLHQSWEDKQHFCMVLDYCEGGDLFDLISSISNDLSLSMERDKYARKYLSQIIDAMAFLHDRKIIHRDLKPQNIVLDSNSNIKIIDFATAKVLDQTILGAQARKKIQQARKRLISDQVSEVRSSFVGSSKYLAPESLNSEYFLASDVWAFGVIAYYFYHNRLPFDGDNSYEIFMNIKTQNADISSSIPNDAESLIEACLRKDPYSRPTFKQLLTHTYFKGVDFSKLYEHKPRQQQAKVSLLPDSPTKGGERKVIHQGVVNKKMFFGNHKPRLLVLSSKGGKLYLAYKYMDTGVSKRQFSLNAKDYAQKTGQGEFMVKNLEQKYFFKVSKHVVQVADQWVKIINQSIQETFDLS